MHFLFNREKAAKVAIIMRTKDRPVFLKRALESVAAQTFQDWTLFIINDGQDHAHVQRLIDIWSEKFPGRIKALQARRTEEQGIGFLINLGIRATKSEYISIHDDDDTWHPDFLEKCLKKIGKKTAIVTQANLVTEFYDEGRLREHSRVLYNPWQRHAISLMRLAEGVTFPACSLLFRRDVLRAIGFYDEALSHKEDWEFSLRLFSRYPVDLLEEPLANFHYRFQDPNPPVSNLIIDHGRHFAVEVEIRNKFLREDISSKQIGLGHVSALAASRGILFKELVGINNTIENILVPKFSAHEEEKAPVAVTSAGKTIEVAYAADERFAFPLAVSLRSMAENHRLGRRIHVSIIDGGISPASKDLIMRSVPDGAPIEITWRACDWKSVEGMRHPERFSPAVYGRIFLPKILAPSVERVLYLDSDTLVLGDIEELFDKDCEEYALLAAQDHTGWFSSPAAGIVEPERFGIPRESIYFNSGVLLFNLAYWRKHGFSEKITEFLQSHQDLLQLGDQNPINICLYEKIGKLEYSWNFQLPDENMRYERWAFPKLAVPGVEPKLLHFVSHEKPWQVCRDRPYLRLYKEYARRTAWDLPGALL